MQKRILLLTRAISGSFSIFNNFCYQRKIEAFRGDKKYEGHLHFTKERANMPLKTPKGRPGKEFMIALMIVNWSWNLRVLTKSVIRHDMVAMVTRVSDKVLRANCWKTWNKLTSRSKAVTLSSLKFYQIKKAKPTAQKTQGRSPWKLQYWLYICCGTQGSIMTGILRKMQGEKKIYITLQDFAKTSSVE